MNLLRTNSKRPMNSQGNPWLPPSRNSAPLVCRLRQLWQFLEDGSHVFWRSAILRHQVHLSAGGESFFQSHGMMGGIHDHCVCRPLSICHCCIRGVSAKNWGAEVSIHLRFPRTGKAAARHLTCPILLSPDTICRETPIHIVRLSPLSHVCPS